MVAGILLILVAVDTFLTGWLLSQHMQMRNVIKGLDQTIDTLNQIQSDLITQIAGSVGNE